MYDIFVPLLVDLTSKFLCSMYQHESLYNYSKWLGPSMNIHEGKC